jgi:hypothetical protein
MTEKMAIVLKRESQDVSVDLLDYPKKIGHKQVETRTISGPQELDVFLENMATIADATISLGLSVGIDVFVAEPVTEDLAGLLLRHKLSPVCVFVQQNKNSFFDHWGYYK